MNRARAVLGLGIAALALAAVAPAALRAAKTPVAGVVIAVKGKPALERAGKKRPLKPNEFLYEADQIHTGASDRASIALTGGAEVRLAENSTFGVESGGGVGGKPASLRMDLGKLWSRLLTHDRGGLNVQTSVAVASVRGTEADIEARDRMTVKVYEGLVDVFNDQGRQSLVAGQMTQVSGPSAAPEPPRQMKPDEREKWQDALKTPGVQGQLDRLQKEAEKYKEIEVEGKDGKKIKIKVQKK